MGIQGGMDPGLSNSGAALKGIQDFVEGYTYVL
jgi:hypothetical protein